MWEANKSLPMKEYTKWRYTDVVIEGRQLVEDKSYLLDEHGKSKVRIETILPLAVCTSL